MQPGLILAELDGNQFLANLDACASVYAAAMNPPEEQMAGRHTIMERHAGYAAFRAIAAIVRPVTGPSASGNPGDSSILGHDPSGTNPAGHNPSGTNPADRDLAGTNPADRDLAGTNPAGGEPAVAYLAGGDPGGGHPADGDPGRRRPAGSGLDRGERITEELAGFAYGFHGGRGQWWHDLVSRTTASILGRRAAQDWFGDSLEIAEVHVLPSYQGRGAGLAMMLRLTAGRPERAAVLSTMDANTPARRLYRGLGFTDLLTGFTFPGTELPYAIMGAPLPLPGAPARSATTGRPSRW